MAPQHVLWKPKPQPYEVAVLSRHHRDFSGNSKQRISIIQQEYKAIYDDPARCVPIMLPHILGVSLFRVRNLFPLA